MDDKNEFDFDAFVKGVLENGDDNVRREALGEAVGDLINEVMAEVAPRLLAVILEQQQKKPDDLIYQNAMLNAVVFTVTAWIAGCTPMKDQPGADKAVRQIREGVITALDAAMDHRGMDTAQALTDMALMGKRLLVQDISTDLGRILEMNARVLQQIADNGRPNT